MKALTCVPSSWGLWGCVLVAACTASADDVRPRQDQLFFPSGLAVSPDGSVLFVANSNSELRYDSGSIGVIDLKTVQNVIDRVPDPDTAKILEGSCDPDPAHRETLVCDEEPFLTPGVGVRIGNFATDIALQDFGTNKLRVIVPTRGDPSVSWADYVGGKLSCTTGPADFALCDDAHRLSTVQNNPDLPSIESEPFGVFADPGPANDYANGFAVVTHLAKGAVTLIDAPGEGDVQIADVQTNLFATDSSGFGSATGVAGRTPGKDGNIIYVGSRTDDRIRTFTVGHPFNNTLPYLISSSFFFLDSVGGVPGGAGGGSTDTRGMRFSRDGDRLYVVNRRPPSLQIFDTSIGPSGVPRNVGIGASDICRQASTVTVVGADVDERAYVTCFQDGEVYVVDPRGQSQVEDIITVGRGPYSVVSTKAGNQLFVSNFLEDTIAVIDISPTSPKRNRVVLRIGKPRVP